MGNIVVVGDSLSAGFQNGVLRGCQQMRGYANLLAKQAAAAGVASLQPDGSALILPLIADPGFGPGLDGSGVSPNDPAHPRVNPGSQATDLAVPGQTVGQALTMAPRFDNPTFPYIFNNPPVPEDGAQMMTNLVLGYPGVFGSPQIALSQTGWSNALRPKPDTIIVWLGNNDVLGVFEGVQSGITNPLFFAQSLDQVLSTLATGKRQIVIANVPDVTLLPFMQAMVLQKNPSLAPQLKLIVATYNLIIKALSVKYNATLVDIFTLVNQLAKDGIKVGSERLTFASGGLFSLDGIHPSDVGYAVIANEFIKAINNRFGTKIRPVDLQTVAATDPLFPPNLNQVPFCVTN